MISHSSVKISLSFLGLFLSYLYSICHLSHCSLVSVPITLLKVKVIHDLLVTKSCSCHFPRIVPGTYQALNKYLFWLNSLFQILVYLSNKESSTTTVWGAEWPISVYFSNLLDGLNKDRNQFYLMMTLPVLSMWSFWKNKHQDTFFPEKIVFYKISRNNVHPV